MWNCFVNKYILIFRVVIKGNLKIFVDIEFWWLLGVNGILMIKILFRVI